MHPLIGPSLSSSSSLTIAPPWPTHELIWPPWPSHKWTNRTTMPTHPLTTIMTRSNNLCFDGAFKSHRRSHRRCFSLSQAHRRGFSLSISLLPLLPPPQPSIFSLKSLSLSLYIYHDLVLGLCHRDFCFVFFCFFGFIYWDFYYNICLGVEKNVRNGRKCIF